MSRKSKWERDALEATNKLKKARLAFSRVGLYLTSLLLMEVERVGEYELHTELSKYKELRKKKK